MKVYVALALQYESYVGTFTDIIGISLTEAGAQKIISDKKEEIKNRHIYDDYEVEEHEVQA